MSDADAAIDPTIAQPRPPLTPHIPDPGATALQEGDFGLDGDLRKTMLDALEANWNAGDPGATTLPSPDDAASAPGGNQPDPAQPSPASVAGEDGAGVGGVADGSAAPDPTAPSAPAPPSNADSFSLDTYAREYFGTDLTHDQARDLFGVLGGLQQLTPEQRAILDQTLSRGQAGVYPATQGQPVAPDAFTSTPASPVPAVNPLGLPPRPDDEYEASIYDKYIAPLATATQAQLSQVQEDINRTTREQLARQQAEYDQQITTASNTWRASHPDMTDGEYDALTQRIIRSGVFGPLVQAHGSITAATEAALEQFFWSDPTLRARAQANSASGRLPGDATSLDPGSPVAQQQQTQDQQRQDLAASVAGGGGSATPRTNPVPKDAASRKQAMLQELQANGDW